MMSIPWKSLFQHPARSLLAVDQQGNSTPLLDEHLDYWRPRISPDGKRVAVEVLSDSGAAQIWVADLDRRAPLHQADL